MNILKFCVKYIKQDKMKFSIYMICILVSAGLSVLIAYFTGLFVDRLIHEQTSEFLLSFSIIFLAINITSIVLRYINSITYTKLLYDQTYLMSHDIIKHIHAVPLVQVEKMDSAYLNQRISQDCSTIIGFVISTIAGSTTNVFTILVSFVVMLSISWSITLSVLAFLIVYMILFVMFKKPLYTKGLAMKEDQGFYFAKMFEQLNFARFAKIHSAGHLFRRRLHDSYETYRKSLLGYQRVSALFSGLDTFISAMINVLLFVVFGVNIVNGRVTVGDFVIFSALSTKLVGSFSYFFNFGKYYQEALVSYDRIDKILQWEIERKGQLGEIQNVYSIELRNVDFSFAEKKVIKDMNMKFQRGNTYAIIGDNGRGKSTLINLLIGVYQIEVGEVYYNGNSMRALDSDRLREKNIGIVEQEPVLMNDTMYNNIVMDSNRDLEESDLERVFDTIDFNTFVRSQSQGLQTIISSKNTNISGGEKQKIALARLFTKNPEVMILDEPTSALDEKTIEKVMAYIEQIKSDKIIIIVTHTKKILEKCDFVISI